MLRSNANRSWTTLWLLLALVFISNQSLLAQDSEALTQEQETQFALTFPNATASEDGAAKLPVVLTRQASAPSVAEIRVRLAYPAPELKYKNFEPSEASHARDLEIKMTEGKTRDQAALEMSFTLPKSGQREFPNGELATINFEFANPAPGTVVSLKADLWVDGKLITGEKSLAHVENARIEIPPIRVFLYCFFFTH